MRNLLIISDDLDGAGCAILFKKFDEEIDIQCHTCDSIAKISRELLVDNEYDKIYFAGISPPDSEIHKMLNDCNNRFTIFDLQRTSKICVTSVVYASMFGDKYTTEFVSAINAWSTQDFESKDRNSGARLNILFKYYGMNKFVCRFADAIVNISTHENVTTAVLNKQYTKYITNKAKQARLVMDVFGNRHWRIFVDEHRSGMNRVLDYIPDVERGLYLNCINLNDQTGRLYTKDFDVTDIVKAYGGSHTSEYPLYEFFKRIGVINNV